MKNKKKDQNKGEDQDKDSVKKMPHTNPKFFVETTLTLQPPKNFITKYFGKISSVTPTANTMEEEESSHDTIVILQEHEEQDTLENID